MNHWIIDYETLVDCTVLCAQHYKNPEDLKVFVVSRLRNDIQKLYLFLVDNVIDDQFHISFNGMGFDNQITTFIMSRFGVGIYDTMNGQDIAAEVYEEAQRIISEQDFKSSWKKNVINSIDLYKLNHWDNPAKKSSLKWIQYSMDWYNIQEMPIHHTTSITKQEQLDTIIQYCINDVKSTTKIYQLSTSQIALRKALTKEYDIDMFSASEPRISKLLFMHFLSKKTGMSKWELGQLRTRRETIDIGSIILPYIKFKHPEFKSILDKFKSIVLDTRNTKGGFKYSITHKGVKTDFGLGGIHGATSPGIYEAKDGMIIMTSDVTSFYPNLAIMNKWSPAHLPKEEFCEQYQWFFEERKKIPKKDPRNYVYKIILNSTYGLSNDENSFLYDPEFTMRITVNGQLCLTMLYEMLSTGIPGSIPIMQNTDGLEMMIPAHYKDKYLEICAEWEKLTKLNLEHDQYNKMILADVNNYIAVHKTKSCSKEEWENLRSQSPHYIFTQDKDCYYYNATKCKGRFEFSDLALHKNKSFLIIPKAIYYYFVHDVLPEHYLRDNKNIFDYCAGVKAKGEWKFVETCVVGVERISKELQKIVRYYVSNKGCKIVKRNTADGREIQTESGRWQQKVFNEYVDLAWSDYDLNEKYYIDRIYKEISNITRSQNQYQLTLF
jgi:hypothetical protein